MIQTSRPHESQEWKIEIEIKGDTPYVLRLLNLDWGIIYIFFISNDTFLPFYSRRSKTIYTDRIEIIRKWWLIGERKSVHERKCAGARAHSGKSMIISICLSAILCTLANAVELVKTNCRCQFSFLFFAMQCTESPTALYFELGDWQRRIDMYKFCILYTNTTTACVETKWTTTKHGLDALAHIHTHTHKLKSLSHRYQVMRIAYLRFLHYGIE